MANKLLSEMGLPNSVANIFAARNLITAKSYLVSIAGGKYLVELVGVHDVFSLTEFELMELLDVDLAVVTSAVAHISEITCPPYQTALSLLEQRGQNENMAGHLPTSLKGLDNALCGGIPFGVVTELFCLKLSLLASLPSSYGGLDGSVIYIDTESKFSSRRMIEIGFNSFPEVFQTEGMAQEMAGRILVLRPTSLSEFTERDATRYPQKIAKKEAAAGCHHWRTNIHSFVKTANAQLNSYPVANMLAIQYSVCHPVLTVPQTQHYKAVNNVKSLAYYVRDSIQDNVGIKSLQKIKVSLFQHGVKLLIIDSMAALLSGEGVQGPQRQHSLSWHISFIKSVAEFSRIPVVVTNQVRSQSRDGTSHYSFQEQGRGESPEAATKLDSHLVAALGIHWAHAVSIRLIFESKSG
ncbi:hypothetical protein MTR67_049758 [Solanum verrucosum]|uniref:RecA family profile 1 domain-containing protein n=1 Tax=Solanum verrucosum TaxID=315347 RepID=A0AAF1A0K7_SOLVR|nr:hypothetical protein MTR67_049758 [Solanum verrucosum]